MSMTKCMFISVRTGISKYAYRWNEHFCYKEEETVFFMINKEILLIISHAIFQRHMIILKEYKQ